MARQKKIDLEHMTEKEKMKYEIAGELGLLERVLNDGWRSLTAKETGRIGKALEDIARDTKLTPEERQEMKKYTRLADAFTPLAKPSARQPAP